MDVDSIMIMIMIMKIAVADLDIRHIRNGECQILHPFKNS